MNSRTGTALALVLLTGCLTLNVNINFPHRELANKLYEMEKNVEEKAASPSTEPDTSPQPNQLMGPPGMHNRFVLEAWQGDEPNLDVDTPTIRKINEQRERWVGKVKDYLQKNFLGEGNDGLLHEMDEASTLTGKGKAEFKKVLKSENEARRQLVAEIAKANELEKDMEKVWGSFATARKRRAEVGVYIQDKKTAEWRKKTPEDAKKDEKGEDY